MTDEETKALLIKSVKRVVDASIKFKVTFLGWNRSRQIAVAGAGLAVAGLLLWACCPVEDYADPVDFFEKVTEGEILRRADFYKEYGVKKIDVLSARVIKINDDDTEDLTASLRFVPKSGIKYYRWQNWFTEELAWLGVFPPEPFDKMFEKEITEANRVFKEWNAYKVGLFKRISHEDEEKLLNYTCNVTRARVNGIYEAANGAWDPFNSLDFTYYYTQYTAAKRDNCPALLCDANGPEDSRGRRFEKEYRKVVSDFMNISSELEDASRKVKKDDEQSVKRLKNALKNFIKTVGSLPRLDK